MPKDRSRKPESLSMTAAAYWRASIEAIAGEPHWSDTRESMIARAARRTGVSFRLLRALYYGETIDPRYSVGVRIDRVAQQQADRFEAVAASLEAQDADFHRETIGRYRALARRVRGET